MDIRAILKQRNKLSDIVINLGDVLDDVESNIDFVDTNNILLRRAIRRCEEAHTMLEWLYERLAIDECEEEFSNE